MLGYIISILCFTDHQIIVRNGTFAWDDKKDAILNE